MNHFFESMPNFWWTGASRILKIQWFPLSILIFRQKSCFLGPTIFKIPQPTWYQYRCPSFQNSNQNNKDITLNALNLNTLNLNGDLTENRRPSKFVDRKNVKHRNGSRSTNPSTNPSRSPSYFTEDDPEVFIINGNTGCRVFKRGVQN